MIACICNNLTDKQIKELSLEQYEEIVKCGKCRQYVMDLITNYAEVEFKAFPKISRLFEQPICITEKIDGTNALVYVSDDLSVVRAGSRTKWITPEDDNAGFAKFVRDNTEELRKLGPGNHYGEWWGKGIQRGYGMDKKVFSLFNTHRWDNPSRPSCCDVVPVLYTGKGEKLNPVELKKSLAAERYGIEFERVEGLMYWFANAQTYFKVIFDK
jgi:bacterioferritin-associated ferredoxin